VDAAGDFFARKDRHHPFDLPPMAKARDIPVAPRLASARCRLEQSSVAKAFDELVRIVERIASMDEKRVHDWLLPLARCGTDDERRQRGVDYICGNGCGARMQSRTTQAGGCFLTICILAGAVLGIQYGNPMKGILIGTGLGIGLAVLTWLIDLWRRR